MLWEKVFVSLGLLFIILGLILILTPLIIKHLPQASLERIPWVLLWVYRKDNLWLATSPILIIIGIIYTLWILLRTGLFK